MPYIGLVQPASKGYAPDSVLIRFKPFASASDKASARRAVGVASFTPYGIVNGLERLTLTGNQSVTQAIDRLSKLPFVDYAEPDYIVNLAQTNDTYYSLLYAIENTGQSIRNVSGTPDAEIDVLQAWS